MSLSMLLSLSMSKSFHTIKGGSRRAEKSAGDDEGCQTGVGRSWSRKEAGLDQEQGQEGQKLGRAGAGQK